jgi:hypothetical protein
VTVRITVLTAATILLGAPARADWPENGAELFSGSHSSSPYYSAPDGLGGAFTWIHVYAGGGSNVHRVFRGRSDGTVVEFSNMGIGVNGFAPDGAGGFYRAYSTNVSPTQKYDVFLHHDLANGSVDASWPGASHELGVGATTDYELQPVLAADGAGGVICAYVTGAYAQVRAKRVNSDATYAAGWPAGGRILYSGSAGPLNGYSPSAFPDGAGGAFVLWQTDVLTMQRVTGAGVIATGWAADGVPVTTNTGYDPATLMTLIPSGPDHVFVIWVDTSPSNAGFWIQRMHRDGAVAAGWPAAGVKFLAGSPIVGLPFSDGAGGLFLSWYAGGTLRVTRLDANGAAVAPWPLAGTTLESLIEAGSVPAGGAGAVEGPSGGLIVTWKDSREAGVPKWRARWLLADGSPDPAQPSGSRVLFSPDYAAGLAAPLPDGNGGLFYDWQEDTGFLWYIVKMGWAPYLQPSVGVPGPAPSRAFALSPPYPNPARTELSARFTLARDEGARLELLDVSGRRVRVIEVAGAGEHVERFERLGELPSGIYLMRLTQGAEARIARVALFR